MSISFKKPILMGIIVLSAFILSGCFIKLMFGFTFTDDIGTFIDFFFEDVNGARCKQVELEEGGTTIECDYVIFGEGEILVTSTADLISDFGIFGIIIDPVVLQVPDDASNVVATFDDGTGLRDLVVSVVDSFMADANTVVTPEPGQTFVIFDFPPDVQSSITGTDATTGPQFDFNVQIEIDSLRNVEVKSMFTGKTEIAGETFYFPLFPCTTDFSTIPAVTIPASPFPQILNFQVESLIGQNSVSGCDNEVYDFTGLGGSNPSIDIQKTPDDQTIASGSDADFEITVENIGDVELTDVTVADALTPDCDANLGTLAVGQVVTYQCTASAVDQSFVNEAIVAATAQGEPAGSITDQDSASVTVEAPPSGEAAVDGQIQIIGISNPAPGATGPGEVFPITVTIMNNGTPLDNLFARVTILEYLSGATPPPELVNRIPGTPPNVGAELDIAFPGDTFDTDETTQVVFEVRLPSIELFRADVSFLTVN